MLEKNLPVRKNPRLKGFDYGTAAAYFLTVCTHNRKNILSNVVGEGFPLPQLTDYGKIAENWIKKIPEKYREVSLDSYVIMPNHIHLLLSIEKNDGSGDHSPTVADIVGWFKYHSTKDINRSRCTEEKKVFQRSFYDHIVRNCADYDDIQKYICENPLRWRLDKLYAPDNPKDA